MELSEEPASWTMTSRSGYFWIARLSSVSPRYVAWLKDGTTIEILGCCNIGVPELSRESASENPLVNFDGFDCRRPRRESRLPSNRLVPQTLPQLFVCGNFADRCGDALDRMGIEE